MERMRYWKDQSKFLTAVKVDTSFMLFKVI